MTFRLSVLVNQESEDDILSVINHLVNDGYEVNYKRIGSGKEFTDEIRAVSDPSFTEEWDVIISDYTTSKIDAVDIIHSLQESRIYLPVIVIADQERIEEWEEVITAGAFDYINREFLPRLSTAIMRAIKREDEKSFNNQAEKAFLSMENYLSSVLDAADDAIVSVDEENRICNFNRGAEKNFGYSAEEVTGKPLEVLLSDDYQDMHKRIMTQLAVDETEKKEIGSLVEVIGRCKNGSLFPVDVSVSKIHTENGIIATAIMRDITGRKQAEDNLHRLAFYDVLTQLPNRLLFTQRVQHALSRRRDPKHFMAVLLLDVDRFKVVNDTLGHVVGDQLLKELSQRLQARIREEDTLARLGGDEFAVLLEDVESELAVSDLCEELLDIISKPFRINATELFVSASIGVSLCPDCARDVVLLMQNADTAMYRAKEMGRNTYKFYESQMNATATKRLSLENSLRRALEREEFCLYYQLQASLVDGNIIGAEALIRWQHPSLGLVSPQEFIPLLEETGLIMLVGEWVMSKACEQNKSWQDRGLPELRVDVNLSPRQFMANDLHRTVERVLKDANLDARFLGFEITEGSIIRDADKAIITLNKFKEMGISLSIDDFGTGYSSLSYLKRMPINTIKVDRSFVQDITYDPNSAAIVRSIIALSHSMNMEVLAEGAESLEQVAFLARLKCNALQGYYFCKPMPADKIAQALRDNHRLVIDEKIRPDPSRRVMLILDDEANITSSLKRALRRDGYCILTATRPNEAFDYLATHEVGVIIADQRMPEMSGTEFLLRVKELYPNTIRIILSGYTDLDAVIDVVNKGGIYKFFTKPWDDGHIRRNIHEAFEYHELLYNREHS